MILQTQGAWWGQVAADIAKQPLGAKVVEYGRLPVGVGVPASTRSSSRWSTSSTSRRRSPSSGSASARATTPRIRRQVGTILVGLASCAIIYAVAVPLSTLFNYHLAAPLALHAHRGGADVRLRRHRVLDGPLPVPRRQRHREKVDPLRGDLGLPVRRLRAHRPQTRRAPRNGGGRRHHRLPDRIPHARAGPVPARVLVA